MRLRRGDRGASLVEVGIIIPFLLTLAIGISEVGFLIIDYVTVTNAARSGARTGSAAADTANADDLILNVVEEAACNLHYGNLEMVTIYRAEPDGSKPVDTSLINEYVNPGPLSSLDCDLDTHGLAAGANCCLWDPADRDRIPPDFDTLGVEVTFSHDSVTGFLSFLAIEWTETAIMQVEPDTRGSL
ncbi:MAG: pilus assembly protein [Actinobacteria bacterium]|nr:pilus assembly protein [Actinomycetota bacterium]